MCRRDSWAGSSRWWLCVVPGLPKIWAMLAPQGTLYPKNVQRALRWGTERENGRDAWLTVEQILGLILLPSF